MSLPILVYWMFERPSNLTSGVPAEIMWDPVAEYNDPGIAVNIWLIRHDEHAQAKSQVFEMVLVAGNATANDTIVWTPKSTDVNAIDSGNSVTHAVSQMGIEPYASNPRMNATTNRMNKFSTGFVISPPPNAIASSQSSQTSQTSMILPTSTSPYTSKINISTIPTASILPFRFNTSTLTDTSSVAPAEVDNSTAQTLQHTRRLILWLSVGLGSLTVLFAALALWCFFAARRKQRGEKGYTRRKLRLRGDDGAITSNSIGKPRLTPPRPLRSPWPWYSKLDPNIWKSPMASAKVQSVAAAEVAAARELYRV